MATNAVTQSFDVAPTATLVARLTWDAPRAGATGSADGDLQAVVVDTNGRIIEAIYYNNTNGFGGKGLAHTGDQICRAGHGGREEIVLGLAELPANVKMILLLACSFTGTALSDVPGLRLALEQRAPSPEAFLDEAIALPSAGVLAACLVRQPGSSDAWQLCIQMEQLEEGRHFMDCLPELNTHILKVIPGANRRQKVAFAMEKGQVMDFGAGMQDIVLGLGWDADKGKVDLDASALILDSSGNVLESIFFGNTTSIKGHSEPGAVEHSGDNQTGEGDGDDERVTVRMGRLGQAVHDVFFCIHVYSKGDDGRAVTFRNVSNPYCRVVDLGLGGQELCRYTLREAGDVTALVIARLRRGENGRFGFNALGLPSRGTMYKDSFPDVQRLSSIDPRELQRIESTSRLST
eukprot:TRINITY_DN52566_c0_g1_i1.p1 TRINITY_DN52566_c0_g1~~TRINITY_DN52566_c0_g1_i1.p1  ORF type:complete len:434 (+),score=82.39 TRINITY_DN52566_c0_g1_i1:86-1303(+)